MSHLHLHLLGLWHGMAWHGMSTILGTTLLFRDGDPPRPHGHTERNMLVSFPLLEDGGGGGGGRGFGGGGDEATEW